jgi:hypothetical protein
MSATYSQKIFCASTHGESFMRPMLSFCLIVLLSACTFPASQTVINTPLASTAQVIKSTTVPAQASAIAVTETPQVLPIGTPASESTLTIVKPDGTKAIFTVADLKKLPLTNMTIGGQVNDSVKIKDIIAAAGVTTYQKVVISNNNNEKVRLTLKQMDDNTLLSITSSGTFKLASIYINKQFWTSNVTLIILN